jgi:nitrogen regulatory protein PII
VKLIIAAIKPFKLDEVREALTAIGVRGMMVTEIKGFGSQSGHTEIYRGAEYAVNFVPKVRLEIVVPTRWPTRSSKPSASTAKTDKIGDGKIFVLDVEQPCGCAPAKPMTTRCDGGEKGKPSDEHEETCRVGALAALASAALPAWRRKPTEPIKAPEVEPRWR